MAQAYDLDKKIEALNLIELKDGNLAEASRKLKISAWTLRRWKRDEDELRRTYNTRQRTLRGRMAAEIATGLLERGQAILARLEDSKLDQAPLNQLASALSYVVNVSVKLEELLFEVHDTTENVVRYEYFYDGSLHKTPPWAGASKGFDRSLQTAGLWEALGQDPPGPGHPAANGAGPGHTLPVAGPDSDDGGPGLTGSENGHRLNGKNHH